MKHKSNKTDCFCSWSGGKDCCLALFKSIQLGYFPKALFTMCIETGERSRSHGLSIEILRAQADSLGLPLFTQNASWENYRNQFIHGIKIIKKQNSSIQTGIFGDIDIDEHKQWEENVCQETELNAFLPLWKMNRRTVLNEFLTAGFKAIIVSVDSKKLTPNFLGRTIDNDIIEEFEKKGIDLCGENGEFHTVVVDGPLFKTPINVKKCGDPVLHSDYWFQDFGINGKR